VAKVDELMGLCDALESQQQERDLRKSVLVRSSLSRFAEAPTPENLGYLFHKSYDIPPAELRKSILTLAVQGKLVPQDPNDEPADSSPGIDAFFEIPASWRWKALGVLGLCRTGKTPPTSEPRNFGTGFPFIGPGQITRNGHITGSEKTITNKGLENSTEAKDYDILMVCIGGSIGKAAISREVLGFNQQINSLRVERDLPKFIYFAVTSDYFQEQVLANASGSATPIINKGKWERIPVPVPPLAEQHRIVAKVDQLMALVDELERQQDASLENASKLLDAIVQEMTSGGQGITATLES
jgi:type I restriction enzyme S subunit